MQNTRIINTILYVPGVVAMALALLFIYRHHADIFILAASCYLFLICATDTLYSKIPNIFTIMLILIGFLVNIVNSGLPGVILSVSGLLTGFSLLLIPFLMGGMGAGDVKALAAMGALLGPGRTFHMFLYMGLIGGLLGLLFLFTNPDSRGQFPHYVSSLKNAYLTRDLKCIHPEYPGWIQTISNPRIFTRCALFFRLFRILMLYLQKHNDAICL